MLSGFWGKTIICRTILCNFYMQILNEVSCGELLLSEAGLLILNPGLWRVDAMARSDPDQAAALPCAILAAGTAAAGSLTSLSCLQDKASTPSWRGSLGGTAPRTSSPSPLPSSKPPRFTCAASAPRGASRGARTDPKHQRTRRLSGCPTSQVQHRWLGLRFWVWDDAGMVSHTWFVCCLFGPSLIWNRVGLGVIPRNIRKKKVSLKQC